MKTKHRTASKAKRRWQADPSAIYRVMSRNQEFTTDEHAKLNLPVRLAFEKIKNGDGNSDSYHILAAASNVSLVCSEKIDPLVEVVCIKARDALLRTNERHMRTGRWGFDGPALAEVLDMIDIYDQLTSMLKPIQIQNAMTEALDRARKGDGLRTPEFSKETA